MSRLNISTAGASSREQGADLSWVSIEEHAVSGGWGPRVVAMDKRLTQHQEAYYLFFVGSMGMALNVLVVLVVLIRQNLRRMTSAFLVHACFLNFLRASFCIPFGLNLLRHVTEPVEGGDDEWLESIQPSDCTLQGSAYIVFVTTSAINMVAMVCAEAYTFGELNVGGNSHGTICCVIFGIMVVYVTSVILHLGPTLIGGDIKYNPDIGSCTFVFGSVTGYVANVMWIVIITFAFVGVGHFLKKFYKEIQMNRPNRVSMLVRSSITICDDVGRKPSAATVHQMTQEAMHRAKIFIITAAAFILCWYPLFLLIVVDMKFVVSPKVYQAFSFIAWTHAMVEPIILICFDRNLNLVSRFLYCDREQYSASQIAFLMAQHRQRQAGSSLDEEEEIDAARSAASTTHLHCNSITAGSTGAIGGAGEPDDGEIFLERGGFDPIEQKQLEHSRQNNVSGFRPYRKSAHTSGTGSSSSSPVVPSQLPSNMQFCRHCSPQPQGESTPIRSARVSPRSPAYNLEYGLPNSSEPPNYRNLVVNDRTSKAAVGMLGSSPNAQLPTMDMDLSLLQDYDPIRLDTSDVFRENDVQC